MTVQYHMFQKGALKPVNVSEVFETRNGTHVKVLIPPNRRGGKIRETTLPLLEGDFDEKRLEATNEAYPDGFVVRDEVGKGEPEVELPSFDPRPSLEGEVSVPGVEGHGGAIPENVVAAYRSVTSQVIDLLPDGWEGDTRKNETPGGLLIESYNGYVVKVTSLDRMNYKSVKEVVIDMQSAFNIVVLQHAHAMEGSKTTDIPSEPSGPDESFNEKF